MQVRTRESCRSTERDCAFGVCLPVRPVYYPLVLADGVSAIQITSRFSDTVSARLEWVEPARIRTVWPHKSSGRSPIPQGYRSRSDRQVSLSIRTALSQDPLSSA